MGGFDVARGHPQRGGMDTLVISLLVVPLLLFLSVLIVPFFVYMMKANHLHTVATHALKEAETIGYVSDGVIEATKQRLHSLGFPNMSQSGVQYPSFLGSTRTKVRRDDADPLITLVITYPAPEIVRYGRLIGATTADDKGRYSLVWYGRSEAYE